VCYLPDLLDQTSVQRAVKPRQLLRRGCVLRACHPSVCRHGTDSSHPARHEAACCGAVCVLQSKTLDYLSLSRGTNLGLSQPSLPMHWILHNVRDNYISINLSFQIQIQKKLGRQGLLGRQCAFICLVCSENTEIKECCLEN